MRYECGGRRSSWPMMRMMMAGRGGRGREPWGEGGGGFSQHGGGRRGRMFASGELRLLLLRLLADQSRHGYELIKAIEELTGGHYAPSPGVVYPTLSLLLDEGMIEEVGPSAARRAFAATDAGRTELAERGAEAERLLARLAQVGDGAHGRHAPPISRAVFNLLAALRGRTRGGELASETVHGIAEILDEAARRIERL